MARERKPRTEDLEAEIEKRRVELAKLEEEKRKRDETLKENSEAVQLHANAIYDYASSYNVSKQGINPIIKLRRGLERLTERFGIGVEGLERTEREVEAVVEKKEKEEINYEEYRKLRNSDLTYEQIKAQIKAQDPKFNARRLHGFEIGYIRKMKRELEGKVETAKAEEEITLTELSKRWHRDIDSLVNYVQRGYFIRIGSDIHVEAPVIKPNDKISIKSAIDSLRRYAKDRVEAGRVINRDWTSIYKYKESGDLRGIKFGRRECFLPSDIEALIYRRAELMCTEKPADLKGSKAKAWTPRFNYEGIKWLLTDMIERYDIKDGDIREAIHVLGIEGEKVKSYGTREIETRYTGHEFKQIKDYLSQNKDKYKRRNGNLGK